MKIRRLLYTAITVLALIGIGNANAQAKALDAQVSAKAELAVAQFQKRAGGRLDYSDNSLGVVEEMLAEAATYSNQMPASEVTSLVELIGSYILTVAYRNHGGTFHWHDGRGQPVLVVGEPKYYVALMTFDKVRGRLAGDQSDSIVFFYEGFVARTTSATLGTKALYF